MKWLKADKALGAEKVDRKKGIIFGVAINTEGEAKGHGVNLDAFFVEEVTRLGNEKQNGLKARFGHPNASSTALGTLIGKYHNFRTEHNSEGKAISRADLHLSDTAKNTPNGDLYTYVLDLAEKEPDMFGTSIVFTQKPGYHYFDESGQKVKVRSSYDAPKDTKLFVDIEKLHANDVVDEPAANPDGLFSAFSSDQLAAKVTQFLDENPKAVELWENDEIRTGFMARYESYQKNKKQEAPNMPTEQKTEAGQFSADELNAVQRFFSKLNIFSTKEDKTAPAPAPKAPAVDTELSGKVEELTSQLSEANEKITSFETQLSEANDAKEAAETQLSEANEKLKALGGGLSGAGETAPAPKKFTSWEDALAFQMDEKGMSFDEADKYCTEHYSALYPEY